MPLTDQEKAEVIYPVTIFKSRYGGVYEGAEWIAVNMDDGDGEYFAQLRGDDMDCREIFSLLDNEKVTLRNYFSDPILVGRGDTPNEAYKAFEAKWYDRPRKDNGGSDRNACGA